MTGFEQVAGVRVGRMIRVMAPCGALFACWPALAQDKPAQTADSTSAPVPQGTAGASTGYTEDIIVTARKRSERLNDVPISISAASGDTLRRLAVTTPADLGKIAPGFIYTRSTYGQPVFAIRGIGFYEESIGIAPTVSAYIDQVPLPFPRMTEGALLDLERVEVLKGPQGTLFGQNSTGGAINFIAAKPTETLSAGGNLTYGRFQEFDGEGYISGKIADGVTARLAARIEKRGDWQQSYTRNDSLGQRDFGVARLLVDVQASDRLKFELNANGWYDKSDTLARQYRGWAPINSSATRYTSSLTDPNYEANLRAYPQAPFSNRAADWNPGKSWAQDNKFWMTSLRADLEIGDRTTLTSITAYSHLNVYSPSDNDGTAIVDHEQPITGLLTSLSEELRLTGTLGADDRVRWVLGGNYQSDRADESDDLSFNGSNTGVSTFRFDRAIVTNNQRIKTAAVFGNVDFKITSKLSVQAGIRYTDQRRSYAGCFSDAGDGRFAAAFAFLSTLRSGSPTTIPPGGCITEQSAPGPGFGKPVPVVNRNLHQDNVSWKAGVSWKLDSRSLIYANVTRGYKAGAFGTLGLLTDAQARPVGQESVLAYEAGFKLEPAPFLQVSGAAFYYDYTDKQLRGLVDLGPPFGALPGVISIPKSRVAGAELNVTLRPFRGLSITGGGTYVNSKVLLRKGDPASVNTVPDQLGVPFDTTGSAFPTTPSWQLTGGPEYQFPLSTGWSAFVGGTATYRSSTMSFFGSNPIFALPGYTLFDARAGFERGDGSVRVLFWGRNVTNKYYRILVTRAHDTITWSAGMPATYGVTVSFKY